MRLRGKPMSFLLDLLVLCWVFRIAICQTSTGEPPTSKRMVSDTSHTPPANSATTSSVTANVTNKPFVTMSPTTEVKYSMILTNTGPAVLDSTIVFNAVLIPKDNASLDPWPVNFTYHWMNMATMQMDETTGGLTSNISKTFSRPQVKEGDYTMTVAAFLKNDPKKIVAFQTRMFTLTEKLNGDLHLTQDLEYQRFPNTFSTQENITLTADVHDQFSKKSQPSFEYMWFENEHLLKESKTPVFTEAIKTASNITLKSVVIASFLFPDNLSPWHRPGHPLKPDAPDSAHPFVKKGNFEMSAIFKDPIQECYITRIDTEPDDRGIEMDKEATINITCDGSPPSSVCLNITSLNSSVPVNQTCQPGNFIDTLQHQVKVKLHTTGWNDIHFYLFNDISRLHLNQSFYGYNPDELNVPALILPIVFGVIGIFIILTGIAYIMRIRKKPLVEVADFDFHPNLTNNTQSDTTVRFSRMVNTLKLMFFRNRYEDSHADPQRCKSATPLNPQDTDSKQFYNSL